jgi:hypothetical protein
MAASHWVSCKSNQVMRNSYNSQPREGANVRSNTNQDVANIVGFIPPNTPLQGLNSRIENGFDWLQVNFEGQQRWVAVKSTSDPTNVYFLVTRPDCPQNYPDGATMRQVSQGIPNYSMLGTSPIQTNLIMKIYLANGLLGFPNVRGDIEARCGNKGRRGDLDNNATLIYDTLNSCGRSILHPIMVELQNRYDGAISDALLNPLISQPNPPPNPPWTLLKVLLLQESQLFPIQKAKVIGVASIVGVAQISSLTIDTYKTEIYIRIPSLSGLTTSQIINSIDGECNSTCTDQNKIDGSEVANSIIIGGMVLSFYYDYFENTVFIGQYVVDWQNLSDEQRWKLVLAAYNGGPGGMSDAIDRARQAGETSFTWDVVQNYLLPGVRSCEIKDYIRNISQGKPGNYSTCN